LGLSADQVVMVGDDIVSDVGGAQAAGIRGVQVRTGKFRPSDQNHPLVKPDLIVDNLKGLVDTILN
jgi:phospholysine phosphohistidine inorganic pyrophosphate phosphatase